MSPNVQFINDVDSLVTAIETLEAQSKDVQQYIQLKEELEAGIVELRAQAQEEGDFQSRFYKFTKVLKTVINYKGIVEKLHNEKRISDADVKPFVEEKLYGQARRIKQETDVTVDV